MLHVYMLRRQTERTGERLAEITEPATGCGIVVPLEDIAPQAILPGEWPEAHFGAGWWVEWGNCEAWRAITRASTPFHV